MAADNTLITVNLRDDPKLKYGTTAIKRKAFVQSWATEMDKEIRIKLTMKYYASNAGAYGADAETSINADGSLTAEEKAYQKETFKDREFNYTTRGRWVDVSGNPVAEGTLNAITELQYWQSFKLDDVTTPVNIPDMNFGAFAAVYAIASAMIARLDTLKILG